MLSDFVNMSAFIRAIVRENPFDLSLTCNKHVCILESKAIFYPTI